YLVANAVDGARLDPGGGAPPITGPALERLLLDYHAAQEQIARLGQRCDTAVLGAMLDANAPADMWTRPELAQAWIARLAARVNAHGLGKPAYRLHVRAATAEHPAALVVDREHHGLRTTQILPAAFFAGTEFRPIRNVAQQLDGLVREGAGVHRDNAMAPVAEFAQAYRWLLEQAKKGRTVQRFKGLGEMNPEQLWETTVNPDTRRLLQVRIEDAVAADQIFSTLMGDVVEPRRDFIEQNALRVANLDV
ncbi:MAG: DNA gyrase subunit B, partial [Proteobacteria bacterium]|nr:DNA gyrase subunit B [Pseudomonadota bacterium]